MAKNFKNQGIIKNPNTMFINTQEEPEETQIEEKEAETSAEGAVVPKGYILVQERKNKRLQLLVRPTMYETLKNISKKQDISVNEIVNQALEQYLKGIE